MTGKLVVWIGVIIKQYRARIGADMQLQYIVNIPNMWVVIYGHCNIYIV